MSTKREKRLEVKYRGRIARRSAMAESLRWYVPAMHPAGLPYNELHCEQFATLAEFKEWARSAG